MTTRLQPDLGHLTLRWSDIDPASGTVSFRRSIATVARGTIVKDTKTHTARRIALDASTLCATQLPAAGVPVRTVSGRLGHANATTTLNVYAHFLEASDRDASDVIAGLLEAPPPETT